MRRFASTLLLSLVLFTSAQPVLAGTAATSTWTKLMGTAQEAGYAFGDDTNLATTLGNIINLFLGALGTVAVLLLLYAGYLWMISGGNEDQVSKAKTIIKQVVVGLVVLSLAYAIVTFVVSLVGDATAKK